MERRRIILLSLILLALVGTYAWKSSIAPAQPVVVESRPEPASAEMEIPPNPTPVPPRRATLPDAKPRTLKASTQEDLSPEKRIARLRQVVAAEPKNALALAELGAVLSKEMRLPEEGIPHLENSIRLDSNNGQAFYDLVGAYLDSGYTDRGTQFLEGLIQSNVSNSAAAYAALADMKASSGDPLGAIESAQAAAEREPGSSSAHSLLGSIYQQAGDTRAGSEFAQAEKLQVKEIETLRAQGLPTQAKEMELQETRQGQTEYLIQEHRFEEAQRLIETFEGDKRKHYEARLRDEMAQ